MWSYPKGKLPRMLLGRQNAKTEALWRNIFSEFARRLGVPVIHAGLAGRFSSRIPMLPGIPFYSNFVGETQIVDRDGIVLARMRKDDGEGIIIREVHPQIATPLLKSKRRFWFKDLPITLRMAWTLFNWHGKRYYGRNQDYRKRFIKLAGSRSL